MKTNFRNLATKLITEVFKDVAQSVTIRHPLYNNYDEESGALISAHEDYTVIGIIGPWKEDKQQALTSDGIRTDDLSLLVSKATLEFQPEINNDTVITEDGTEWAIVYSETDPAEAAINYRLTKVLEE